MMEDKSVFIYAFFTGFLLICFLFTFSLLLTYWITGKRIFKLTFSILCIMSSILLLSFYILCCS